MGIMILVRMTKVLETTMRLLWIFKDSSEMALEKPTFDAQFIFQTLSLHLHTGLELGNGRLSNL